MADERLELPQGTLEQFRNWRRPKRQAFSWFSPKENHTSRFLSGHSNCETALDLLVLKALALESFHGWALSERLQQTSREALQVQQGSLDPALHRLERRGWIKARWAISQNNRRTNYYELTRQGQKQLEVETLAWGRPAQRWATYLICLD